MISDKKLTNILKDFTDSVEKRYGVNVITNEDIIRYYLVDSFKKNYQLSNESIILEQKYKELSTSSFSILKENGLLELDIYLNDIEDKDYFIEVKYHKNPISGSMHTTYNAGSVFNDILRLSSIDLDGEKLFVYIYENNMKHYYQKSFTVKYKAIDFLSVDEGSVFCVNIKDILDTKFTINSAAFKNLCCYKNTKIEISCLLKRNNRYFTVCAYGVKKC